MIRPRYSGIGIVPVIAREFHERPRHQGVLPLGVAALLRYLMRACPTQVRFQLPDLAWH